MSNRLRHAFRWAGAGLLTAVAAGILTGSASPPAHAVVIGYGGSAGPAQPAPASGPKYRFVVVGGVGGMYPGASRPLTLLVYNPNNVRITVMSITTTVGSLTAACPAADFHVGSYSGSLAIGANQAESVSVTATMDHSAPDACQGVTFPLQFSGMGEA